MRRDGTGLRLPRPRTIALLVAIVALYHGVGAFSAAGDLHRGADVVVVTNSEGYWALTPQTITVSSGASNTSTGLTIGNGANVDAHNVDLSVTSDPGTLFESMSPDPFALAADGTQAVSFTVNATGVTPGTYTITLLVTIDTGAGRVEIADVRIPVEVI